MIIPIELRFKADKDSKSAFRTDKTIKSHDVNSVEFHISIEGLELTDNHTAKILSVFHSSKSQVNVDCEIVEGKIIYKPDTKLISRHEHVTNYVYVYHNNQSLDVREFIYTVDLSKVDETSLEVKEVYDQSYADLLADFEQALNDYKDNLPQADSVRADIDEILNQFGVDSQAKLSQYDTDVQQVITDINEAEESRVQAEGQRDSSESIRVQSESQRVSAESNRVNTESERVLAEDERENAETQRKTDHANRSAELDGKADKVVIRNMFENGDFSEGTDTMATGFTARESTTNPRLVDGVQYWTGSTTGYAGSLRAYPIYLNSGDIYYISVVTSNVGIVYSNKLLLDTNNEDGLQSSTFVLDSDYSNITFRVRTINQESSVSTLQLINLTETFGTGNEPTKEEMDELIKVIGYIDGEYALNNKEMLIWTLALIRRNKNAIVALGGA